jgi:hypothetical protein
VNTEQDIGKGKKLYTIDFRPYAHQFDALQAWKHPDIKYVWLCGGVGSGKTKTLVHAAFDTAIYHCPGRDLMFVGKDIETTWRKSFLPEWRRSIPGQGTLWKLKNRERDIIISSNGAICTLTCYSAHNRESVDGILSASVGCAFLDEPNKWAHGRDAWKAVHERARLKSDFGNKFFIAGTPRGFNWLADEFDIIKDHPESAWENGYYSRRIVNEESGLRYAFYVRASSSYDNKSTSDGFSVSLQYTHNEQDFKQEVEGHMIAKGGVVFPGFNPIVHVIPHHEIGVLWRNVNNKLGGADFGNISCNVVAGTTRDNKLIVADEWYEKGNSADRVSQGMSMHEMTRRYGLYMWYADPAANTDSIPFLRNGFEYRGKRYSIPITKANNAWDAGITRMRGFISPIAGESRIYISDRCVNLIREMRNYMYLPDDEIDYSKPMSKQTIGDDHAIDALRYIVNQLSYGSFVRMV